MAACVRRTMHNLGDILAVVGPNFRGQDAKLHGIVSPQNPPFLVHLTGIYTIPVTEFIYHHFIQQSGPSLG